MLGCRCTAATATAAAAVVFEIVVAATAVAPSQRPSSSSSSFFGAPLVCPGLLISSFSERLIYRPFCCAKLLTCSLIILTVLFTLASFHWLAGSVCVCVFGGSGGAIQYWRAIWWVLAGWKKWKVVCVGWDRCCSLKWRNAVSEGRLSQLICQTRTGDQTSERKKRGKLMEKTQSPFFSFAFLRWRALFHFWAMAIIGATIAIICSSSEQAHSCSAIY